MTIFDKRLQSELKRKQHRLESEIKDRVEEDPPRQCLDLLGQYTMLKDVQNIVNLHVRGLRK